MGRSRSVTGGLDRKVAIKFALGGALCGLPLTWSLILLAFTIVAERFGAVTSIVALERMGKLADPSFTWAIYPWAGFFAGLWLARWRTLQKFKKVGIEVVSPEQVGSLGVLVGLVEGMVLFTGLQFHPLLKLGNGAIFVVPLEALAGFVLTTRFVRHCTREDVWPVGLYLCPDCRVSIERNIDTCRNCGCGFHWGKFPSPGAKIAFGCVGPLLGLILGLVLVEHYAHSLESVLGSWTIMLPLLGAILVFCIGGWIWERLAPIEFIRLPRRG